MARIKSSIDQIILNELLPSSDKIQEIDLLYRMMREYPKRPAKGLRPFLCTTCCRAFGGKEADAYLTAASIELFQNWILIHDDIEDGSMMRRGSPVLHRIYDWALAINAGDALHARTWGVLLANKEKLGVDKTIRIMQEFLRMVNETTEGQHIELGWVVSKRWDLMEDDYYTMCLKKTAWYTAISPLRLGGIIAGAKQRDLDALIEIGSKLGIGFQIHDDVLNLSGDAKYGKEITDDLLEGKRTLILTRLLTICNQDERSSITAIMDKKREEKSEEDIKKILSLIRKYGVIEYASNKAKELANHARSMLKSIEWKGDRSAVDLLDSVARFSVERNW
jgi:geranylgeranyl diphosphate synthase type II